MQSNVTFPSKRLMLSLFVCSVLPILLMGRSFLQSDNIFSKSCVNRIRNIFHAVVLCSFLFDKAQNKA